MKIRFPLAVAVLSFALAACGGDADDGSTGALPPLSRKPASTSRFDGVKVGHILISKDGQGNRTPKVKRTKAEAFALANSYLNDIKGGRDFLEMAAKFSEDVDAKNKPNTNCGEPGVYEGAFIEIKHFDPAWQEAALKTPVGAVAPEPVESEHFGYFLIKRIK